MLQGTHLKYPEKFKFLCSLILTSSVFYFLHYTTGCLFCLFIYFYFNWRLITLQYYGGFCHTLTWISHGCTCVPHPDPPSHLPPHPIPLGHPSAPAPSILYHAFIDYAKAFNCVDHNKLRKILKDMEIPDHLTCLLRNCIWVK